MECTSNGIAWFRKSKYAHGCSFEGNDFMVMQTRGDECGLLCFKTPGCSHYTWSINDDKLHKEKGLGLCHLKTGYITRDDAVIDNDLFSICGLVDFKIILEMCQNKRDLTSNSYWHLVDLEPSGSCSIKEILIPLNQPKSYCKMFYFLEFRPIY